MLGLLEMLPIDVFYCNRHFHVFVFCLLKCLLNECESLLSYIAQQYVYFTPIRVAV